MRAAGVVLGSVAMVGCMSACSFPVVEHELSSGGGSLGPPAVLAYKEPNATIDLVEIDGRHVDAKRLAKSGMPIWNTFKLSPGTHRIRFRGEGRWVIHPDVVEFVAEAGKRYQPGLESVYHKETDGQVTTLYFGWYSPTIREEQGGKLVKIASGILNPLKPLFDAEQNPMLYEEATLPRERTARVYFRRPGVLKGGVVIGEISGGTGDTRVEYRGSLYDVPWQWRLLPGEYRFAVSLEGGWLIPADVESGVQQITLKAEAGHTYRIKVTAKSGDTTFQKDVAGNTEMRAAFRWNAAFEDVTGKGLVDE